MVGRSLRQDLRDATGDVHETLHRLPDFRALAEGRLSASAHNKMMQQMGGFYLQLDPRMIEANHMFAGYAYHPRSAFFADARAGNIDLPPLHTREALAGAAYVVDGSVLGGQVLARSAGTASAHPYWHWCRTEGASVWCSALALIESIDTGPEAREQVVATALQVFTVFHRWMAPADVGDKR